MFKVNAAEESVAFILRNDLKRQSRRCVEMEVVYHA